jgi:L-serine/L-threonine ammonia-lyase
MPPLHIETPLIESRALSGCAQRRVWLKMEALQPPGSFKLRGIGHACQEYVRRGAARFLSSSDGNAGMAVAYAGRQLGVPVTVVVPETTSDYARELLRREAAEVIVHGRSWQEANKYAQSLIGSNDAFLHPFDDQLLWEGHASMIDEVARAGWRPDAVVLSVGGGGLLCGVVEGLQRNGWRDTPVIAVETHGTDSLAQSLAAGSLWEECHGWGEFSPVSVLGSSCSYDRSDRPNGWGNCGHGEYIVDLTASRNDSQGGGDLRRQLGDILCL